jgi:cysteine desulfurase / selenocysteine lyase
MTATAARIPTDAAPLRDEEFPILRDHTYLNAASQGPVPARTVRAIEEVAVAAQFPHTARAKALPAAEPVARERLARLIGAEPGDFVFTGNTTHGMNICAQGIAWRPGDNVVVPEHEFPSLAYTWFHLRERGVEVRFVPFAGAGPTIDEIMSHTDDRTRAVACSAITWNTGWRADLEGLGAACARRGVLLVVDGIQAVGARRLDVRAARISAMSFHGYKWLLSGFGLGALYVAPEAVDRIAPTFIGAQAVAGDSDTFEGHLNWKPGPARYGAGGLNRLGLAAYASSLGLLEEVGIAAIEERTTALAEGLYAGLRGRAGLRVVSSDDPAHRSAVIVFTTGDRARDAALVEELEGRGIIVALRPLGVRVSPHFYNTEADIARLLDALPR